MIKCIHVMDISHLAGLARAASCRGYSIQSSISDCVTTTPPLMTLKYLGKARDHVMISYLSHILVKSLCGYLVVVVFDSMSNKCNTRRGRLIPELIGKAPSLVPLLHPAISALVQ